jgi:hypothetical protein
MIYTQRWPGRNGRLRVDVHVAPAITSLRAHRALKSDENTL